MGQYYLIVNADKKQYLHPHKFDEGLKLMEFGHSTSSILFALTVLLADGNNRGGGDLHSDDPLIGSWAGNRIVIAGDYADPKKFLTKEEIEKAREKEQNKDPEWFKKYGEENLNLYLVATNFYKDISEKIIEILKENNEYELFKRE